MTRWLFQASSITRHSQFSILNIMKGSQIMGSSNWSDAAYHARQNHRQATKQTAFTHDQDVRASGVVRIHDQMNPRGVTRESRDSDQHPDSLAIGVIFDVTGSMGSVPRV